MTSIYSLSVTQNLSTTGSAEGQLMHINSLKFGLGDVLPFFEPSYKTCLTFSWFYLLEKSSTLYVIGYNPFI